MLPAYHVLPCSPPSFRPRHLFTYLGIYLTLARGRIQTERKRESKFTYTALNRFDLYGESAAYRLLLSDPSTGTVPVDFTKIFFSKSFPLSTGRASSDPGPPSDCDAYARGLRTGYGATAQWSARRDTVDGLVGCKSPLFTHL